MTSSPFFRVSLCLVEGDDDGTGQRVNSWIGSDRLGPEGVP